MFKKYLIKTGYFLSGTSIFLIIIEIVLHIVQLQLRALNSPPPIAKNDKNLIRIITIGESTTANIFNTNLFKIAESKTDQLIKTGVQAWPKQLENMLIEHHFPVKVYNLAIPATNSNLILSRIKNEIEIYKPQIVISMMGINDSNLWLKIGDDSFWSNLITLKILNWCWKSLKSYHNYKNSYSHKASILPFKDFSKFKHIHQILKLLQTNQINQANKLISVDISDLNIKEKSQYHAYLANILLPPAGSPMESFTNSYQFYRNSINEYFWVESAIENYSYLLAILSKSDECYKLAKNYFEYDSGINDFTLSMFSLCANKSSNKLAWLDLIKKYTHSEEIGFSQSTSETTKKNYRELFKLLNDNHITLIAMQYPLKDINHLKYYFQEAPDFQNLHPPFNKIKFVSNKENFEEALKIHRYEDLFIDRFGGFFGHTTQIGHKIIALATYEAVIKNLKEK